MRVFWLTMALCIITCSCNGPTGPTGSEGDGYESLTDPGIQPRVIFSDAGDGTVGPYDAYNQIQVRFNKIMDLGSLKHSVTFSSALGDVSADTASFATSSGDLFTLPAGSSSPLVAGFSWRIGQQYKLSISADARDMNGNRLATPYTAVFIPEPYFRILSQNPRSWATNIRTNRSIRLTFNSPIGDSIVSAVSISPAVAWQWRVGLTSMTLTPPRLASLDIGTDYTVRIDTAAHDQFGNHLPALFSFGFSTIPFRVSAASPTNGSTIVLPGSDVSFTLTAPVDTSTVRNAFSITPPIPGNLYVTSRSQRIIFDPITGLNPQSTYTIILSSSLRPASGTATFQPFVLTFTTTE